MNTELLVGTRKGLVILRGERGGEYENVHRAFPGQTADYAMRDPRSGLYFAAVTHGQFGAHVYRTDDPLGEWEQVDGPAFPEGSEASVDRIWIVEPGEEPGSLWAGVAPAALFQSRDDGATWELNRGMWDQPSRPDWEGGLGGLCLHSICPWPGDPQRLAIGISAAGVWLTEDGGVSWRRGVEGLDPRYMPEEARAETMMHCVHNLRRHTAEPETLYMQFHGGVYRSDDAGERWTEIGLPGGLPADFGFPIEIDPEDPNSAYVIPLTADIDRVAHEGKLRVYETRDRGASWTARTEGLPQENAYLTVLRQAFCRDRESPVGLYFGTKTGELYASSDAGQTWSEIADHLPTIVSVRVGA